MSEHDHLIPHPRSEAAPRLTAAEYLHLVIDDAGRDMERDRRAERRWTIVIAALLATTFLTAGYALAVAKGWVH